MNNENRKRLLILGTQVEFEELVRKAVARGYETIVCDGYADGPARKWADRSYLVDVREIDRIVSIVREEKIDHILTSFSDIMFECMVQIAEKAGLPCYMPARLLPSYRNKAVSRQICEEAGIRIPAYCFLRADTIGSLPADITYPAIIKPTDSYGSRGLQIVRSADEVRAAFAQTAGCSLGEEAALLESISKGQELNCMAYVLHGGVRLISIADRMTRTWDPRHIPINYAIRYPSVYFDAVKEQVTDILQRYVERTGQTDGPLAMQCFYDGEGIEVCEIAGRFFGFEHEMVTITTGLDMEDLLLDMLYAPDAVERALDAHDPKGHCHASCVYLQNIHGGVLADQSSLYALKEHPALRQSLLFYKEGEQVDVLGPRQYFARYYVAGKTREEMLEAESDIFAAARAYAVTGEQLLYIPPAS